MIQQTSIESFNSIMPDIGTRQKLVLNAFSAYEWKYGNPGTDREITDFLGLGDPNWVRPRRNELVKKGLLVEDVKRICNISKKRCITWKKKKRSLRT